MKNFFSNIVPIIDADAHCDIPCGIYDPTPAKIAARTILRMVLQLKELGDATHDLDLAHQNSMTRRILVKEQHADSCEKELMTLWADFFKPEHRQRYPDLDSRFWNAIELCSKNKQNVSEESATALNQAVDEIAKIFYEVKNAPEKYAAYQTITEKMW